MGHWERPGTAGHGMAVPSRHVGHEDGGMDVRASWSEAIQCGETKVQAYLAQGEFTRALEVLIGYSLNDTIVIFDRIRENMRGQRRERFAVGVRLGAPGSGRLSHDHGRCS